MLYAWKSVGWLGFSLGMLVFRQPFSIPKSQSRSTVNCSTPGLRNKHIVQSILKKKQVGSGQRQVAIIKC